VLVRWLTEPQRLSREQERVLRRDQIRGLPLAVSATTLIELALISSDRALRLKVPLDKLLAPLEPGGDFWIVPIDLDIAREIAVVGDSLRDPADRVIVATARVHRLRLVTSDQRIIASKLCPVVE
jgi:PIN domain nuclease of toxin-antitoxin system